MEPPHPLGHTHCLLHTESTQVFLWARARSKSIFEIDFASDRAWLGSETEQKGRVNEGEKFQSGEGDKGSGQTRKATGASVVRGSDGWEIWPWPYC